MVRTIVVKGPGDPGPPPSEIEKRLAEKKAANTRKLLEKLDKWQAATIEKYERKEGDLERQGLDRSQYEARYTRLRIQWQLEGIRGFRRLGIHTVGEFLPVDTLKWARERLPPLPPLARVKEDLIIKSDEGAWVPSDWWNEELLKSIHGEEADFLSDTGNANTCPICSGWFFPSWTGQKYCDPVCRDEARKRRSIQKRKETNGDHIYHKSCMICGESFTARRDHAQTCSGACRVALHRKKQLKN